MSRGISIEVVYFKFDCYQTPLIYCVMIKLRYINMHMQWWVSLLIFKMSFLSFLYFYDFHVLWNGNYDYIFFRKIILSVWQSKIFFKWRVTVILIIKKQKSFPMNFTGTKCRALCFWQTRKQSYFFRFLLKIYEQMLFK